MEVRQTHAFAMEFIKVRGFDNGIAVAAQISVPLIIGYDKDYIWSSVLWHEIFSWQFVILSKFARSLMKIHKLIG